MLTDFRVQVVYSHVFDLARTSTRIAELQCRTVGTPHLNRRHKVFYML